MINNYKEQNNSSNGMNPDKKMAVKCHKCQSTYYVPISKIPNKGIKAKCKKCGNIILIMNRAKFLPDFIDSENNNNMDKNKLHGEHNGSKELKTSIEEFKDDSTSVNEEELESEKNHEQVNKGRILCPDEKCDGDIGYDGICNQCGKDFQIAKTDYERQLHKISEIEQKKTKFSNMMTRDLNKPLKRFTISFIIGLLSMLFLFLTFASNESSDGSSLLAWVLILVILIASLLFYINLGILAKRIDRSWIVWVGLTFITKPFGPIVSFFWMRRLVKKFNSRDSDRNMTSV